MKTVSSPAKPTSSPQKKPRLNRKSISFHPEPKSTQPHKVSQSSKPAPSQKVKLHDLKKMYINQLKGISRDVAAETRYRFKNSFLRLEDYSNLESVRRCFDALHFANEVGIKSSELLNSVAFVARSSTYDDIHKAMKYGVWSSTLEQNKQLHQAFNKAKLEGRRVLLFFRSVKDDMFCGVAEVVSGYIEEQKFNLWWQNDRYQGIFNIRWVFVKNVPLTPVMLQQLAMTAKRHQTSRNVADLRDGDRFYEGEKGFLLDVFARLPYNFANSVFYYFGTFDRREDGLISSRTFLDFEFKLQKTERRTRQRGQGKRKCSFMDGYERKGPKNINQNNGKQPEHESSTTSKDQNLANYKLSPSNRTESQVTQTQESKAELRRNKKRQRRQKHKLERKQREQERNEEYDDYYKDHSYYERRDRGEQNSRHRRHRESYDEDCEDDYDGEYVNEYDRDYIRQREDREYYQDYDECLYQKKRHGTRGKREQYQGKSLKYTEDVSIQGSSKANR